MKTRMKLGLSPLRGAPTALRRNTAGPSPCLPQADFAPTIDAHPKPFANGLSGILLFSEVVIRKTLNVPVFPASNTKRSGSHPAGSRGSPNKSSGGALCREKHESLSLFCRMCRSGKRSRGFSLPHERCPLHQGYPRLDSSDCSQILHAACGTNTQTGLDPPLGAVRRRKGGNSFFIGQRLVCSPSSG